MDFLRFFPFDFASLHSFRDQILSPSPTMCFVFFPLSWNWLLNSGKTKCCKKPAFIARTIWPDLRTDSLKHILQRGSCFKSILSFSSNWCDNLNHWNTRIPHPAPGHHSLLAVVQPSFRCMQRHGQRCVLASIAESLWILSWRSCEFSWIVWPLFSGHLPWWKIQRKWHSHIFGSLTSSALNYWAKKTIYSIVSKLGMLNFTMGHIACSFHITFAPQPRSFGLDLKTEFQKMFSSGSSSTSSHVESPSNSFKVHLFSAQVCTAPAIVASNFDLNGINDA